MNKNQLFNAFDQQISKTAIVYRDTELVAQGKFCIIAPMVKNEGSVVSNALGDGGTNTVTPPSLVIQTNQRHKAAQHIAVMDSVKQQEMQDAIQSIAVRLRDIGAGHHSDWLIKITNTKELTAAARDIEQGGYYQEAAELYAVAAEFQSQLET